MLGHAETKLSKYHDSNIAQTAAGCILSISLRKSMNLRSLYALWLLWWGFYQISLAVCSYFTVALRHAVRPEEQLPNAVHLQLTEHWLDTSNIKTYKDNINCLEFARIALSVPNSKQTWRQHEATIAQADQFSAANWALNASPLGLFSVCGSSAEKGQISLRKWSHYRNLHSFIHSFISFHFSFHFISFTT